MTGPPVTSRTYFEPTLKDPILVCGVPGSGFVGKLAVDHLIESFKAKKFMEGYSGEFPPQGNVREDGVVRPVTAELYECRTGQRNDLLLFTADAQPSTSRGEYELCEWVLGEAERRGVKEVVSLAAYITGTFTGEQRVFGAATNEETLKNLRKCGVRVMKEGGISGVNGIITAMARFHGMEGSCLLGETSGYLVDPVASESVLDSLSKALGISIDLASLKKKSMEAKQVIGQIQRMTEQEASARGSGPGGQPGYIG